MVSYNVVHTTPDVRSALTGLRNALSSDGQLFLIESCRNETWATLCWGVLDGWWYANDSDVRPCDPMLEHHQWSSVLREVGLRCVFKCPRDTERDEQSYVEKFLFVCVGGAARTLGGGDGSDATRVETALLEQASDVIDTTPTAARDWWHHWTTDRLLTSAAAAAQAAVPASPTSIVYENHNDNDGDDDDDARQVAHIANEVAAVWQFLLHQPTLDRDTSFNDLGGESLVNVRMVALLRERLGVQLSLTAIYGYPTVNLLSTHITRQLRDQSDNNNDNNGDNNNVIVYMFSGQGASTMSDEQRSYAAAAQQICGGLEIDAALRDAERRECAGTTQQAIVAMHAAQWQARRARDTDVCVGLSVGELGSLIGAGVLSATIGVELARARGEAMARAAAALDDDGAMMTVRGVTRAQLDAAIARDSVDDVFVANRLDRDTFVLSGVRGALERVRQHSTIDGARWRMLSVPMACHSPLMRGAAVEFARVVERRRHEFASPRCTLLLTTGDGVRRFGPEHSGALVADALAAGSIAAPLDWYAMLSLLFNNNGVHSSSSSSSSSRLQFVELGVGQQLSTLAARFMSSRQ
jgi:malonyl CoA-acyl carrier protein transacylase